MVKHHACVLARLCISNGLSFFAFLGDGPQCVPRHAVDSFQDFFREGFNCLDQSVGVAQSTKISCWGSPVWHLKIDRFIAQLLVPGSTLFIRFSFCSRPENPTFSLSCLCYRYPHLGQWSKQCSMSSVPPASGHFLEFTPFFLFPLVSPFSLRWATFPKNSQVSQRFSFHECPISPSFWRKCNNSLVCKLLREQQLATFQLTRLSSLAHQLALLFSYSSFFSRLLS